MDDPTNYSPEQIASFAYAMKTARGDRSTKDVVKDLPGYTSNTAINNWEKGDQPPKPPAIFALERALQVEPGYLSQHLGFLPVDGGPECTVESAVAGDPDLTDDQRDVLRSTYQLFTQRDGRR